MDRIEKFFRKVSKKDNFLLEKLISSLLDGEIKDLDIKKLTDSDFYRLRKNRFRIIFHYEKKEIIIDSVKLRDDKTYK